MFGIKVTSNGVVGWIVGKDADIWLFKDKASAAAELKRLKTTWHAAVHEVTKESETT